MTDQKPCGWQRVLGEGEGVGVGTGQAFAVLVKALVMHGRRARDPLGRAGPGDSLHSPDDARDGPIQPMWNAQIDVAGFPHFGL